MDAEPCAQRIRVRAQDVALAEVVQAVAKNMAFRLDLKVNLDEKVSVDRAGPPEELLKHLLKSRNVVLQTDPSPRCGGKETLTTVWVLPAGETVTRDQAAAPTAAGTQSADAPAQRTVLPERPRGTRKRMTEEQWQQMKQDYKAGKLKADPETGLPVPVDGASKAPAQ